MLFVNFMDRLLSFLEERVDILSVTCSMQALKGERAGLFQDFCAMLNFHLSHCGGRLPANNSESQCSLTLLKAVSFGTLFTLIK